MNQRVTKALSRSVAAAALLLVAHAAQAADPLPTEAGAFRLKLEPGVSFPLTNPQKDRFDLGGSIAVKGLWSLNRYLSIGPSLTYTALPTSGGNSDFGTATAVGASLMLAGPRDLPDNRTQISPWIDGDAQFVRTGPLNRFGFAVGAGVAMAIGKARATWLGPFVRYSQIRQGSRSGYDNGEAKILTVGLSLDIGGGVKRPVERAAAPPAAQAIIVVPEPVPTPVPDRDGDGILDNVDRCPEVAGTVADNGCPPYKKLVVQPDKLELREKLFFDWNQATIQPESHPALDEVVQALKDNKGFKVEVQGHASSEGGNDHNQDLSERRAEAVLDYLVAHGVPKDRLSRKGFSSSVPAGTNSTAAGREANRRVEFVVQFKIVTDGSN